MSIRVLLVEDDGFTRSTLAAALERHGIAVAQALGSAREALALADLPDVAVLDLDLGPGPNGIDLALVLRDRAPAIGIVLLTSYDDPRLIASDLPPVPRGTRYLRKREVSDVTSVLASIMGAARRPMAMAGADRIELSDAQIDVLRAVAEGLSTAEIAHRRGVSDKAVEKTITQLCARFGLDRLPTHNQRVRLAAEYHALTGQVPR
jgi:DNA-binding NarL/FixJ family response regulator